MRYYEDYSDERLRGNCIYCNDIATTKDHIPAKVFLVKPYPENLQTVPACVKCNNLYSKDESFVAFFIDYLIMLENQDSELLMEKIKNRYKNWQTLEERILNNLTRDTDKELFINLEDGRIRNVLTKFSSCHILYETGTKPHTPPSRLTYMFLPQMSSDLLFDFNHPNKDTILPEIGSRLFQRSFNEGNTWEIVQEGVYRYYVNGGSVIFVRIVIKEMLFCEAVWNELE